MAEKLGDGPISEKYMREMNAVARALDDTFNGNARGNDRKTGFVLLVYPFNSEGGIGGEADKRCNFISNGADRRDIVTLFKEMITRFEGQPEKA